jgi:hypothetical protein
MVEIILAIAIFFVFLSAFMDVTFGFWKQQRNAINKERATYLAEEAIEASRNIRDASFSNLIDGTHGLSSSGNQWSFSGASDVSDVFTRSLTLSTIDSNTKRADVSIIWADETGNNSVSLSTYLTNWRKITPPTGITVNKTVINHGMSKTVSDFEPYQVGATTVVVGVSTIVDPGTYLITETPDSSYTETFSGDCDSSGNITLIEGDAKVCNITNEEKPSQLTVTKVVSGGSKVPGDFSLFVDATPVVSGATNTFNSGSHTVSETPDPQYTGSFSGDCNSSGVVTLVAGTTKSCTLTNTITAVIPTVTSPTSSSVYTTSAVLGANVTSLGIPASISARGICWGTSPSPVTNCTPEGGTTTGIYTQTITGLTAGTLYYYRGYATNATGTGYSADGTFTTASVCALTAVGTPTTYDNPSSNSVVISKPTGVAQNDIMFAYIGGTSLNVNSVPSGWSLVGSHVNGTNRQYLYYKVAGAGEGSSYTFGLSSSVRAGGTISAFRGCFNTTNPIDTSSNVEYVTSNTTYRAASMNLSTPDQNIIIFPSLIATGNHTFTAPTTQGGGWSTAFNNGNSSSRFHRSAFYKFMSQSGATGNIDSIGDSGSTGKHAFAVVLRRP